MAFIFGQSQPKQTQSQQPAAAAGVSIQTSCYNKIIPVAFGTVKLAPNLLDYGNFQSHTTTSGGGGSRDGKGGGGGGGDSGGTSTTTYSAMFVWGLCHGPIFGVGTVWSAKTETDAAALGLSVFIGKRGQTPWGYLASQTIVSERHTVPLGAPYQITVDWPGPPVTDYGVVDAETGDTLTKVDSNPVVVTGSSAAIQYTFNGATGTYAFPPALAGVTVTVKYTSANQRPPSRGLTYPYLAYAAASDFDLGDSPNSPNNNFEVEAFFCDTFPSSPGDADPRLVIESILTNKRWGIGTLFPAACLGDNDRYQSYAHAMGLGISVAYTEQSSVSQAISDLADYTNADIACTNTVTLIPRCEDPITANGHTFAPLEARFSLDDDDWLKDNAATTASGTGAVDPLVNARTRPDTAVNEVSLEYLNRANQYAPEPVTARDPASIRHNGRRAEKTKQAHCFTNAVAAHTSAQLLLQHAAQANEWMGTVGEHAVAATIGHRGWISSAAQNIDPIYVKIKKIDEQADGSRAMVFVEIHPCAGTAAAHAVATAHGSAPSYNGDPGDANAPVIFEPPPSLTATDLEVWMAVTGGSQWGGCKVHISEDGVSYGYAGTVRAGGRTGVLARTLPAGTATDTVNTLSVDMSSSRGQLPAVSQTNAIALNSLCWVSDGAGGGELLAYRDSVLTGPYAYNLSYLMRGAYGTPIAAKPKDSAFCRVDGTVFYYPFRADQIGKTISIKLLSYNVWTGGLQTLDEVDAYSYTIRGTALMAPLPNVTSPTTAYRDGILYIAWTGVSDWRGPDYEIRAGDTPAIAPMIGRTTATEMPSYGNGRYWIAAHYRVPNGPHVYSEWVEVAISGARLTTNVVADIDEAAAGWPGTMVNMGRMGDELRLGGTGNILDAANVLAIEDLASFGGVASSGIYTIPAAHRVDIGRVATCPILMSVRLRGKSQTSNILALSDLLTTPDLLEAALGQAVTAVPQLRISQDGTTWGDWQDWIPGSYTGMAFDFRVLVFSTDSTVIGVLSGFDILVDVPDRTEDHQVTLAAGALTTIAYPGGPFLGAAAGGQGVAPNPQLTVVGGQADDTLILTNVTLSGFDAGVVNAGAYVVRALNYRSQGY